MITLNRRRYMGGGASPSYDENSYIQDGLVFQLDGINKGSNQGKWTDLVGGVQFTIPESEYLTEETNGFTWTGNANMPVSSGTIPSGESCTVEVAMIRTGTAVRWGAFASNSGSSLGTVVIARFSGNFIVINRKNVLSAGNIPTDQFSTVSMNAVSACVNKVEKTLSSSTDYISASQAGVGYVYAYGGMRGTIYAIRIYNRQLTVAEMQANQAVDLARFGT